MNFLIGTDLLEKKRIESLFYKSEERFLKKILTDAELKDFDSLSNPKKKISYLSNNFACKEAISKVLGTGFSNGVTMKSIEVRRGKEGAPFVKLKRKAKELALKKGISDIKVSISDTKDHSLAFAIGVNK